MPAAFLAHNLAVRRTAVEDAKLVTSVGWIGNAAHQAECSDHNEDSTGDVHAIDCMTLNVANQKAMVQWALAHPDDLEYVINQRTIWSRSRGFKPAKYLGTDPHTNHVHISGRHGLAGNVPHVTCTGYDRAAEKITPEGIDMPLTAADKTWITSAIKANTPTPVAIATAVWDFAIGNAVVSTAAKPVVGKVRDFISTIHLHAYQNWLSLGQPANQWPQPAKPAVPPIAEQTAAATAAQPTN